LTWGTEKLSLPNFSPDLNWIVVAFVFLLAFRADGVAQSSKVLTLEEAVDFAQKNYPAVARGTGAS